MKMFFGLLFLALNAMALESYPLEIGLGWDSCQPNRQGQKVCDGQSPNSQKVIIPLHPSPDGTVAYGLFQQSGKFRRIGFQATAKVSHFPGKNIDDMITLTVITWDLQRPQEKFTVESEVFARSPEYLTRMNLIGHPIGNEDDFSQIILGIRAAR